MGANAINLEAAPRTHPATTFIVNGKVFTTLDVIPDDFKMEDILAAILSELRCYDHVGIQVGYQMRVRCPQKFEPRELFESGWERMLTSAFISFMYLGPYLPSIPNACFGISRSFTWL